MELVLRYNHASKPTFIFWAKADHFTTTLLAFGLRTNLFCLNSIAGFPLIIARNRS
jgi:hypothetical protein